jgi:hypothetical protein
MLKSWSSAPQWPVKSKSKWRYRSVAALLDREAHGCASRRSFVEGRDWLGSMKVKSGMPIVSSTAIYASKVAFEAANGGYVFATFPGELARAMVDNALSGSAHNSPLI